MSILRPLFYPHLKNTIFNKKMLQMMASGAYDTSNAKRLIKDTPIWITITADRYMLPIITIRIRAPLNTILVYIITGWIRLLNQLLNKSALTLRACCLIGRFFFFFYRVFCRAHVSLLFDNVRA